MNDFINQLKAYKTYGIAPDAPIVQAMLQGDFQLPLIAATPATLADIQSAWSWMLDNVPRQIRGDLDAYYKHCRKTEQA